MSSQVSASNSYDRLHDSVKRWIWDQGWTTLRDVQAQAIPAVLGGGDVIVSAATASGKTEAAWLPIISELANAEPSNTVQAIYISPLKALINDQFTRLRALCETADISINRRHGDVTGAERKALTRAHSGVLLITPESLEAMFVLQGPRIRDVFGDLRYVVVDELHSFIGAERGAQLQSLMHRLDLVARKRIPRVALSATLADFRNAADFLRPGGGTTVAVIESKDGEGSELRLQVRGYERRQLDTHTSGDVIHTADNRAIAEHLFDNLRGHDNLVFANSRAAVESFTDLLGQISEERHLPNEFLPHHGNLSKQFREDVEQRLKNPDTPTTAVCTSTLELGIDIGSADSVAQIGAPGSVSALRQRVGRTGRRDNKPAVLRVYVSEQGIDGRTTLLDRLRPSLVQTIAVVELMLERWYEPPNLHGLHLSTDIQQVLSIIAQHGGATAPQLFSALSGNGPFRNVSVSMFTQLLRDMATAQLLTQESDGTLHAGSVGEPLLNHYSFYAAFETSDEYRLVTAGRTLGTIPIDYPVLEKSMMIFAGKRWRVVAIDTTTKTIELTPARGGTPPKFMPSGMDVADGIRRRMQMVYDGSVLPAYLDQAAVQLLDQGRSTYRQAGLDRARIIQDGNDTVLFPWRGTRVMNAMSLILLNDGVDAGTDGIAITCTDATIDEVYGSLVSSADSPVDAVHLASLVKVREGAKYDRFLGDELLNQSYAARDLDVDGAAAAFAEIADSL
jgi:ATP-dependent Lhr-like helicase